MDSKDREKEGVKTPSSVLIIPFAIASHLIKVSAAYHPQEMCGLLTGRRPNKHKFVVNNFHWIENIDDKTSKTDYLMHPQALMDVLDPVIGSKYVKMVGVFHTHPTGRPMASVVDIAESGMKVPYLIYSPIFGGFRAWFLDKNKLPIEVKVRIQ